MLPLEFDSTQLDENSPHSGETQEGIMVEPDDEEGVILDALAKKIH
ncbi:hypothetical protein HBZS_106860 [Helicobacter bizzozeronii CCUG 35545]|nr:hypothetical protein HBZS_106860 [Helicobacter bizzozeronii CCUG 35545]